MDNCKIKLQQLFELFFKDGFHLNDYYSGILLNYLESFSNSRSYRLAETQFLSNLILNYLKHMKKASQSIRLLILKVLQNLLRNELQFKMFSNSQEFILASKDFFLIEEELYMNMNLSATQLAIANLCTEIISHSSGLHWTIQNKVWEKLLRSDIKYKAPKTENAVYNYVAQLVWKLDEYGLEQNLIEVLGYLADPLRNILRTFSTENIKELDALEGEKVIYASIIPKLKTLLAILNKTECTTRKNIVVPLLVKYYLLEGPLNILLKMVRDPSLLCLLAETTFSFTFAYCMLSDLEKETTSVDIGQRIIIVYCKIAYVLLENRQIQTTMLYSVSCVYFWSKLDKTKIPSTFERHERVYDVQMQFLLGILTPLLEYSSNLLDTRSTKPSTGSVSEFWNKITSLLTEHIIKIAYMFKTAFENEKNSAIDAVTQLVKLTKYLNKFQAGFVYQTLFYVLHCYVLTDDNGALTVDESPSKCPEDIKLISLILDLIKTLLNEHDIKWQDTVEIIGLQNCLMNIVKQNLLPTKQLLQALDLIDLSIKKFMSPDLALLMESRRGDTLNEILVATKQLIQHPEWEIRDSTLHLLLSCTELAYVQYTPMQKLLEENNLLTLAVDAIMFDEEPYVQTTALRTLAASTRIGSIWNRVIDGYPDLYIKLISILTNNAEGIIRKEAAYVLCEVYKHQKLSCSFTNRLYNLMLSVVLNDLHWEVQLAGLYFWKLVIKNIISYRGMIDGKFPSVTFCKERRKIIRLNEVTIKHQLIEMMNDLAATGCLKVLNQSLCDEVQIMKTAYKISQELMSVLDFYALEEIPLRNVTGVKCDEKNHLDFEMFDFIENSKALADDAECVRNQIIEDILSTPFCDLIQNLHDKNVEVKHEKTEEDTENTENKWMDPNEFITDFKRTDYLSIIEAKSNWNSEPNNFDTFLDELLASSKMKTEIVEECD